MNRLILGDMLEIIREIETESIDLVLTDPPYKLNKTTGGKTNKGLSNKWQGNIKGADKTANIVNNIRFSDWLPEVYRVLKDNSHYYLWINDKNLSDLQKEAEKVGFRLHNILIWKKNNATPNRWYMKNCEFILFLYKGKAKPINNMGMTHFFDYPNKKGNAKLHPTEKPIPILNDLILNSTNINDIVLDCFMGSGSTGVACKETNRRFVGIEIDDKYYEIAKSRITGGKGLKNGGH